MRIIGILLLLLGLVLTAGGLIGAALNLGSLSDPIGRCSAADSAMKDADAAVKRYEAAKGTPGEVRAKKDADDYQAGARIAEKSCYDFRERYKTYGIICVVVAMIGILIVLTGAILIYKSFRVRDEKQA